MVNLKVGGCQFLNAKGLFDGLKCLKKGVLGTKPSQSRADCNCEGNAHIISVDAGNYFCLINCQSLLHRRQYFLIRRKSDPAFLRHLPLADPNRKLAPITFDQFGFNA